MTSGLDHVANVFSAERGICFRFVDGGDHVGPKQCDGTPTATGKWSDRSGRRWTVDACDTHANELQERR